MCVEDIWLRCTINGGLSLSDQIGEVMDIIAIFGEFSMYSSYFKRGINMVQHAVNKGQVAFPFWRPLARFRKPLKLSEVNISCGDTFIITKATTT